MILVDRSVWVDHLRASDPVLAHPFVTGELALGNLRQRDLVLDSLQNLPQARMASEPEVLAFITQSELFGLGIGYVDAHLLAATRLTSDAGLWTRDKRLLGAAERLGIAVNPAH